MADLTLEVNAKTQAVTVTPETPLLYVLTNDLGLLGPKFGCGLGQCGACSVLVDGIEMRSCITPTAGVVGKSVTTLEGLPAFYAARMKVTPAPELHPLQEAFWECHGLQCGFCTPGMILSAYQLLLRNPKPSEPEIRHAIDGNLCRCTGYEHIVDSVQYAAKRMKGKAKKFRV